MTGWVEWNLTKIWRAIFGRLLLWWKPQRFTYLTGGYLVLECIFREWLYLENTIFEYFGCRIIKTNQKLSLANKNHLKKYNHVLFLIFWTKFKYNQSTISFKKAVTKDWIKTLINTFNFILFSTFLSLIVNKRK